MQSGPAPSLCLMVPTPAALPGPCTLFRLVQTPYAALLPTLVASAKTSMADVRGITFPDSLPSCHVWATISAEVILSLLQKYELCVLRDLRIAKKNKSAGIDVLGGCLFFFGR